MSTIIVEIVKVEILEHPNGDRLEIAQIGGKGGFKCVVTKGEFKTGDLVIFVPPDAVLPENILKYQQEHKKISIPGGRVREVKVRGVLSEGLCLDPKQWLDEKDIYKAHDVTEKLGITKYEPPPPPSGSILRSGKGINFNYINNNFKKYYCVEKFKKCPGVMSELGQDVVITVKFHGANWRAAIVKKIVRKKTLWENIKGWFIKEDPQEFLVGSHDKIKKPSAKSLEYGDYYNTDTWWRMAKKYDIENVVRQISENERLTSDRNRRPDVAIYGEVIGPGVQKGYAYGVEKGELELRIFDIMIDGQYCDWDKVVHLCNCFNLPVADELYRGPWSLDLVKMAQAVDTYDGKKCNREGVVIRPLKESWHPKCGRVILKCLNPDYLLDKTNTCFH